jgi:hypothetical protein
MEPTKEENLYIDSPEKFKNLIDLAVVELNELESKEKSNFTLASTEKAIDVLLEKHSMDMNYKDSEAFLRKDTVLLLIRRLSEKIKLTYQDVCRAQRFLVDLARLTKNDLLNNPGMANSEIDFCKNIFFQLSTAIQNEVN